MYVVLDDFVPSISIELSFPKKHKAVELGNSIKPKHVECRPIFNIYTMDAAPTSTRKSNATYALALTDPDATSRSNPVKAQMCHWIATNVTISPLVSIPLEINGRGASSGSSGESGGNGINELMPYFPPSPPPKTSYHRYVFVVLTSASQEDDVQLQKPSDRPHWGYEKIGAGVREWAEENHMVVVGE